MITILDRAMNDGESVAFVQSLIIPGRVLDLGCGHRHHTHTRTDTIWVDVDIERHATDPRVIALDAREVPTVLHRMKFTSILLLDLVEHLTKEQGKSLLKQLEKMTQRIVVCTPLGELWVGGDQKSPHTHKCGWTPEEFQARGYDSRVYTKMHDTAGGFFAWNGKP